MSRSRCTLRVHHLERFAAFCEEQGWQKVEAKGPYEALRMRHPEQRDPLIVHKRDKTNMGGTLCHLTTWGISQKMAIAYIRSKK